MEMELTELTAENDIAGIYDIYRHCMFMPTKAEFNKKMASFLEDEAVKIFACLYRGAVSGVIVLSFVERSRAEILGIAVAESVRRKGIGSFMISRLAADYGLHSVFAETDDDAAGFYRKNGFGITAFSESYDGETVIRYKCELGK